ncbi:hypothetical protein NA8A_13909 [Nitratireductor indicus C115]|uniref:HPr kinase/phosphorylase C-terminal domain-containing protein n=1 Tax=Nitratireductor indicus C115 TaxID=1231190 RepID=K2PKS9_9HYPH|nr:HPr kinase/phosphatase C-terminal domain-containing protein [Nitratireductor indicus]EKF41717.1 hypothetical protein NA8A_13909 [Nitratireductor indicus C115]SFQ68010.1 HPr Serine kinase C-terminal domain-containing protein [Nitratireductor indicus]
MRNRHATALVVGDRGLLIEGPSGSGKTMLALELIAAANARGIFARLVSDDQVMLAVLNDRLIAHAPRPIAGLVEARGHGPAPIPFLPATLIDLVIRLVPENEAPRVAEDAMAAVEGVTLPLVSLPRRQARHAVHAVAARLHLPPFRAEEASH